MKTPIKDSLNFKSLNLVKELIPKKSVVNSFLLYSGFFDFELARDGRYVTSHTDKYCIYEFWSCVLYDPERVEDNARFIYNELAKMSAEEIEILLADVQENLDDSPDPYVSAAYFFLLNQLSDLNLISSGKMHLKNFNPISLHTLQNFKVDNFHVSHDEKSSFLESVHRQDSDFLFLPVGNYSYNLFEHGKNKGRETTTVYHKQLFDLLVQIDTQWVVVYKKHLDIFDLYKNYNLFMVDKYGKRTLKKDKCEDIVIANF